ncbi:hypothetical protein K0M31_011525 [Melipona bicolor]|uniref:Uncharacterized protein n=1 Tax=Melipona bicolor TaxID=60889 RepID=A0AA40KUQ2_9HYME|nr:hypothetical protein K0M31_011525 [Melipona bicolor]
MRIRVQVAKVTATCEETHDELKITPIVYLPRIPRYVGGAFVQTEIACLLELSASYRSRKKIDREAIDNRGESTRETRSCKLVAVVTERHVPVARALSAKRNLDTAQNLDRTHLKKGEVPIRENNNTPCSTFPRLVPIP